MDLKEKIVTATRREPAALVVGKHFVRPSTPCDVWTERSSKFGEEGIPSPWEVFPTATAISPE